MVKNPPAVQETQVQSLGGEDPLEKGMLPTAMFLLGNLMNRGGWWAIVHGVTRVGHD